ncbi:MotA/TolQ/ExbB proton channel family protein [Microvenator marinus]|jgi:biopolymer transport protein ExbB|uniref:MotA/TolQ/ExbB proton channel family protein n=1 Tax=Microvenator marinus TaxID=2600177 RepID=A0A5B8XLY6_9DELT|nr:MotA/TolQ/ExbB proton channel family protein [Microvenator marinus]QED26151.1 MotA/TolQ/ExbB proton channel family protein [Microvenator marinus]
MLTHFLLQFTRIGAEWVLWVLVLLSFACIYVMLERLRFYKQRAIDIHELRTKFNDALDKKDYKAAAELLSGSDAMEARVVLFGLRHHERGPAAVEDLLAGALATEKVRYDKGLGFLATVGSNAPFIGLFGTVVGIINAFDNLAAGTDEGAKLVMAAIAEALVATGVGILVAIPAVMAYNVFKGKTKGTASQAELLGRSLVSHLRGAERGGQDGGV